MSRANRTRQSGGVAGDITPPAAPITAELDDLQLEMLRRTTMEEAARILRVLADHLDNLAEKAWPAGPLHEDVRDSRREAERTLATLDVLGWPETPS